MDEHEKSCFVIMPISDPSPYVEGHFQRIYQYLISDACIRAGYEPKRAVDVNESNLIALDVIERIYTSDIIICDLSSRNPNVMYELGICHVISKLVVLIKDERTEWIFDIQGIRTVIYASEPRGDRSERDIVALKNAIIDTTNSSSLTNSPIGLLPDKIKDQTGGIRVFGNRHELVGDVAFKEALDTCTSIDLIALSAQVAITVFSESLSLALRRDDFFCRFVLYDPSHQTSEDYDKLVELVGGDPIQKRRQARQIFEFSKNQPDKIQLKVIRKLPLLYNLWIAKDKHGVCKIGHISAYAYDKSKGGPAFQTKNPSSTLIESLREEFEYVWKHVATAVTERDFEDW